LQRGGEKRGESRVYWADSSDEKGKELEAKEYASEGKEERNLKSVGGGCRWYGRASLPSAFPANVDHTIAVGALLGPIQHKEDVDTLAA
jgi:hypothetical protein